MKLFFMSSYNLMPDGAVSFTPVYKMSLYLDLYVLKLLLR